jgi:hypothetical protein
VSARRPLPAWFYAVPDARNVRIAELEAALLETNDVAARLSAALLEEKKQRFVDRAESLLDVLDVLARSDP